MIFPPRPANAITPTLIPVFENKGWWAQKKLNGTCNVVSIDTAGNVSFKTRHGVPNKAWEPTSEITTYFAHFPDSIFICELLHNKERSIKNTMYIFDVIRYNGQDLVGKTFEQRQELLKVIPLAQNIIIAKNYKKDLLGLFQGLHKPIEEGLVIKNPKAILQPCMKKSSNQGWMIKCRRPHKNYSW